MNEDLNTALLLMGVGMITVFLVLTCVVILGNVLTRFVNRFVPLVKSTPVKPSSSNRIQASKIAIITSAVEVFTKGKGQIKSIKKID